MREAEDSRRERGETVGESQMVGASDQTRKDRDKGKETEGRAEERDRILKHNGES